MVKAVQEKKERRRRRNFLSVRFMESNKDEIFRNLLLNLATGNGIG